MKISDELIREASDAAGIEFALVAACVEIESARDPWAKRFEPQFRYLYSPQKYAELLRIKEEWEIECQMTSFGLMQIMGAVLRELGHAGPITDAFDPVMNLRYGCEKLKRLSQKYETPHDVIAAYNAGGVRKTLGGLYVNQRHVDRFDRAYRHFQILR